MLCFLTTLKALGLVVEDLLAKELKTFPLYRMQKWARKQSATLSMATTISTFRNIAKFEWA